MSGLLPVGLVIVINVHLSPWSSLGYCVEDLYSSECSCELLLALIMLTHLCIDGAAYRERLA